MSLREQRRLVKRRRSRPGGPALDKATARACFLVRPPFGGGKCDVSLFSLPPFGGRPRGSGDHRERGGYEGRRRAKRSALLRAGAGGRSELKRASGSEAAGNLQALRLHEIKALRPPSCPFPCPPSASHAPSAPLPALAAQALRMAPTGLGRL